MVGRNITRIVTVITAAALALIVFLDASPAFAQDRTPPTRPTNFRVTGVTSYTVSFAWNPSTDNTGTFSYVIHASSGADMSVSQTATSFHWTSGLSAAYTYSFYIYAIDAAGNRSRNSNTVTVTLPRDTIPPTAPVLSLTEVTAGHVSLEWTPSTDDGPFIFYQVLTNGGAAVWTDSRTSATIVGLTPATTYTFTVRARDNGINFSPPSNAVTITTSASDPGSDTVAPTTPVNLTGFDGGCGEAWLSWDHSTDNVSPQIDIRYEVFVNGTPRPESTTHGYNSTIAYAVVEGSNTFEIFAIDSAGNRSGPASITMQMFGLCQ